MPLATRSAFDVELTEPKDEFDELVNLEQLGSRQW